MELGDVVKIGSIDPRNKGQRNKDYGTNRQKFYDIIELTANGNMVNIQLIG